MAPYQKPSPLLSKGGNRVMEFLVGTIGLAPSGVRVLSVPGSKTGEMRSVPIQPMPYEGFHYLVSSRGDTEWVRNIRAAGNAELKTGRKKERIAVEEVPDEEKVALIREYLRRWAAVSARYFGVGKDASDEELARIAPNHPVFRYRPADPDAPDKVAMPGTKMI